MTIANDIINGQLPDFNHYLGQGESLDDIDEYGFTPLIESVIACQLDIAKALIARGVEIDKPDVTGRTALHWATDNHDMDFVKLLLNQGANANAHNLGGQSVLVYPLLREQWQLKQLLYQHGACLNFANDFVNAKLLGHRYALSGDVDVLAANGEYIELDYEGFILEFSLDVIRDSLQRFLNNFAARHLRAHFSVLMDILDGFDAAIQLLKFQHHNSELLKHQDKIARLVATPILILPVAFKGHALCFVRCGELWAKIDRGENSLREGTVNVYQITQNKVDSEFVQQLLFKKQTESFIHHGINKTLGLKPILRLPISPQITGNCSWANVEAIVPTAFVLQRLIERQGQGPDIKQLTEFALSLFEQWHRWDQDRALNECIQSFYLANAQRQATKAAMLGALLFQACDHASHSDVERAEQILAVLTKAEYRYVLDSYLEIYCIKHLTPKGNNLLKLLDDCGIDPNIGVTPVATGLKKKGQKKSQNQ